MKIYSLTKRFCWALFLVLQIACATTPSQNPAASNEALPASRTEHGTSSPGKGQQSSDKQQISKGEAIAIANEHAAKSYQSLESFRVVACEQSRLWVIIYDGGGPEYYLDKMSGSILSVQKFPQALNAHTAIGASGRNNRISGAKAIEIAKKHFVDFLVSKGDAREHVNDYDAFVCELDNAWRVFFEYHAAPDRNTATLPNSNPPSYVIDKKTGEIIFTTHPTG